MGDTKEECGKSRSCEVAVDGKGDVRRCFWMETFKGVVQGHQLLSRKAGMAGCESGFALREGEKGTGWLKSCFVGKKNELSKCFFVFL